MVTVNELRSIYGFQFSEGKADVYANYIRVAEEACLGYIGVSSTGAVADICFTDGGSQRIMLPLHPVLSIEGVYIEGTRTENYRFTESGIVTVYDSVPRGLDAVRIEYTAGWTAETIPADVKMCIAMTVQNIARMLQTNQVGVLSKTTDAGTESIEQKLLVTMVSSYLDRYRLIRAV